MLLSIASIGALFYISGSSEPKDKSLVPLANASTTNNIALTIEAINSAPATAAGIPAAQSISENEFSVDKPTSPIDRIKAIQSKTVLHQALIEDHKNFTRYPAYNKRIEDSAKDPTVRRYDIDERTTHSNEDDTSLTLWSDKKYYLHGDQATFFVSLRDDEGIPIKSQFIGQLIYDERENLQVLEFTDDDRDGIYQYTLPLSSIDQKPWDAGLYKVLVVNNTNKIADALTFTLSQPDITATGNYRDHRSEKYELVIQAEVEVITRNRFYFQASLYDNNTSPIGSTQQAIELLPGKHWVSLPFSGKMIHDSGASGAYMLKNLSLAKVALPIQRAPIIHPDYITNEYDLADFASAVNEERDWL